MSTDTEDLAARLAALEGTSGKKAGRARRSPLAAILGVGGIVAIGGLAWAALQPETSAPMKTAAPDEFQTTGSGFGDLAPARLAEPEPASAPAETGPSETELALMERAWQPCRSNWRTFAPARRKGLEAGRSRLSPT